MNDYVIINGVNSNTISGLKISKLPPITKPQMRTLIETIDGRDGDLITDLGYSAYDKQLEIGLWGTYDINTVISFFNQEGTITFSNEADKFYNFKIINQIDYQKLLKFKTAVVVMHCQPFKYQTSETPIEGTPTTITGEGTSLTLNNTLEAKMKLDLKGNTYQYSTTGKNLFDTTKNTLTPSGLTITPNSDGSLTITGTTTGGVNTPLVNSSNPPILEAGTYTRSIKVEGTITKNSKNVILTGRDSNNANTMGDIAIDQNTTKSRTTTLTETHTMSGIGLYVDGSGVVFNCTVYIQVEKSSSATSWEKYTGGTPSPNPSYPQDIHIVSGDNSIKVEGKNYFQYDTNELYTTSNNGAYILQANIDTTYINVSQQDNGYYVNSYTNTGYRWYSVKVNLPKNTNLKFLCGDTNISGANNIRLYGFSTLANGTTGTQISTLENGTTFNSGDYDYYLLGFYPYQQGRYIKDIQIVNANTTDTSYAPYKTPQTYPINLGNNINTPFRQGTYSGGSSAIRLFCDENLYLQAGTYTISTTLNTSTFRYAIALDNSQYPTNTALSYDSGWQSTSTFTFTISTSGYLGIGLSRQDNEELTPSDISGTAFAIVRGETYFTPIELCKIGDYQDYIYKDSGKWYLHKEIGKVVLTGGEDWSRSDTSQTSTYRFATETINTLVKKPSSAGVKGEALCNRFEIKTANQNYSTQDSIAINSSGMLYVYYDSTKTYTGTQFKGWLANNNLIIYYVLETPTNTEITDTSLKEQLEDLSGANSYDNQTNINQTNNDYPFWLSASTTFNAPITINNIGNIYAKPILELEGSGNITINLNSQDILAISLGDTTTKIVLDIPNLEAYNPTDSTLMNRLVVGDYMKFLINSGNNTLKIDGNITSYRLTSYSRWI